MIDKDTQDKRCVGGIVKTLRESFETKHADICRDHNALREVIAVYDLMLKELVVRPPRNREEMEAFLKKYLAIALTLPPIVCEKIVGKIKEIWKFFSDGAVRKAKLAANDVKKLCSGHPILKLGFEMEITLDLDNHILLSRNFLAVYIGDPIKAEEDYKNLSQSEN